MTAFGTPGKRSLEQKIIDTRALLAKYEAQAATLAIINNVQAGDAVTFDFGRADKKRSISGIVLDVRDAGGTQGKVAAVETGEGFDKQVFKVRLADITENATAAARGATAGDDPLAAS